MQSNCSTPWLQWFRSRQNMHWMLLATTTTTTATEATLQRSISWDHEHGKHFRNTHTYMYTLHIYIQTQALTHSIRSLQSFKWLRCNTVFIHTEFVLYVCLHFGLLISLDASKRVFTGIWAVFLCALSCFTVDGALANQRKWMHSSLCAISLSCSLSIFPVSVSVSHLQSREPRISNEKCTNFNESFMNISRCTFFRIFTKCQIARNRQMFFTIDKCNSRFISTLFLLLSIFFCSRSVAPSLVCLWCTHFGSCIWNEFVFGPVHAWLCGKLWIIWKKNVPFE